MVEDGEREESSPSLYQTPPVASLDKNQEPIPVRITTMREGQLIPVVEQEEIDELFQAINREREADHDDQEELSVRAPNHQWRRLQARCLSGHSNPSYQACTSVPNTSKSNLPLPVGCPYSRRSSRST